MIGLLVTLATCLAISALFRFHRDDAPVSRAVWVPYAWLLIACSRPISSWLTLSAPGNVTDAYIEGSPLDRNVLTLILICALIVLSRRKRQVRAILRANAPLVIFFSYCAFSMLWSDYPFVVFKR